MGEPLVIFIEAVFQWVQTVRKQIGIMGIILKK